jgi:hypothetical protein
VKKYRLIFLSLIFCVLAGFSLILAQQGDFNDEPALVSPYKDKQDCMDRFDLDEVDILGPSSNMEITKDVMEYFTCIASIENSANECKKLRPGDAQICRDYYNGKHAFVRQLLSIRDTNAPLTPELVNGCMRGMEFEKKDCMRFLEAFKRGDASICKMKPFSLNSSSCTALITLDQSLGSPQDRDAVAYFVALKNLSVDDCKRISNKRMARDCEAYVTGDKKVCQACVGFKKIKEAYCNRVGQR